MDSNRESVLHELNKLRLNDVLTDIYIVSGSINKCADVEFERGSHLGSVHSNGAHFKEETAGSYRLSPAHKCVLAAAVPWFCERLTKSTFKVTSTVQFMWVPVSFDALQLILDFAYGIPIFKSPSSSSSSSPPSFPSLDILELLKGSRFFKLESLTRACDDFSHRLSSAEVEREKREAEEERRRKEKERERRDGDGEERRTGRRGVDEGVKGKEEEEANLVQVPVISSGEVTTTTVKDVPSSGEAENRGRESEERGEQEEEPPDESRRVESKEKEKEGETASANEGRNEDTGSDGANDEDIARDDAQRKEKSNSSAAITMTITVEPVSISDPPSTSMEDVDIDNDDVGRLGEGKSDEIGATMEVLPEMGFAEMLPEDGELEAEIFADGTDAFDQLESSSADDDDHRHREDEVVVEDADEALERNLPSDFYMEPTAITMAAEVEDAEMDFEASEDAEVDAEEMPLKTVSRTRNLGDELDDDQSPYEGEEWNSSNYDDGIGFNEEDGDVMIRPERMDEHHQLSSRPTKDFDNRSSSASEFDSAIVERPQDRHEEEFEEEDEEEEDVLWDFRDTDRLEETPKPMVQNNKTGTKKFPKYQIRHQSLQPSAEDAKHFSVDKDQLGRITYNCNYCDFAQPKARASTVTHLLRHHAIRLKSLFYNCPFCLEAYYPVLRSLWDHLRVHHQCDWRNEGDDKILLLDPPTEAPDGGGFRCVFCSLTSADFAFLSHHQEEEHGLIIRDKTDPNNLDNSDTTYRDNQSDRVYSDNKNYAYPSKDDPKMPLAVVQLQKLDVSLDECPVDVDELVEDQPLCDPTTCSIVLEGRKTADTSTTTTKCLGDDEIAAGEDHISTEQSLDAEETVAVDERSNASEDRSVASTKEETEKIQKSGKVVLTKEKIVYLQRWLFYNQKDPLPDVETKRSMSIYTGLTIHQIQLWFTKARRHELPSMRQHSNAWLKRLFKDVQSSGPAAMRGKTLVKLKGGRRGKVGKKKIQSEANRVDAALDHESEEAVEGADSTSSSAFATKERYHGVRNAYPRRVRMVLLDWLRRHRHHPFVTSADEFRQLREATNLTNNQIKLWLRAARRKNYLGRYEKTGDYVDPNEPARISYPRHLRLILLKWLQRNRNHQYVTPAAIEELKGSTGLTPDQIRIWVKCARKRNYLERYEKTGDYVALTGSEMDVWKPPPSTPPASSSSSSSSSPSSVWHMPLGLPPQPPSQPQPRRPFATPFARPALPRPTALHPNTANIAGIGHLARPLMGGQILIKRPYMPPNRKKSVASIMPTTPMTTSPSKVGVVEKEIFTEDIRRVLIQWLKDHKHHPYATEAEVDEIIAQTGLTKQQVRRWTHTARTRNYIKRIEETGDYVSQRRAPRASSINSSASSPSHGALNLVRPTLARPTQARTPMYGRPSLSSTLARPPAIGRPSSKSQLQEWLAKNHRRIRTLNDLYRCARLHSCTIKEVRVALEQHRQSASLEEEKQRRELQQQHQQHFPAMALDELPERAELGDVLNRSMVQASPGGISGDSESDNKLTLINGEVILLPQKSGGTNHFGKDILRVLYSWLYMHRHHPYPTSEDQANMALAAGLTRTQVKTWFQTARTRRLYERIIPLKTGAGRREEAAAAAAAMSAAIRGNLGGEGRAALAAAAAAAAVTGEHVGSGICSSLEGRRVKIANPFVNPPIDDSATRTDKHNMKIMDKDQLRLQRLLSSASDHLIAPLPSQQPPSQESPPSSPSLPSSSVPSSTSLPPATSAPSSSSMPSSSSSSSTPSASATLPSSSATLPSSSTSSLPISTQDLPSSLVPVDAPSTTAVASVAASGVVSSSSSSLSVATSNVPGEASSNLDIISETLALREQALIFQQRQEKMLLQQKLQKQEEEQLLQQKLQEQKDRQLLQQKLQEQKAKQLLQEEKGRQLLQEQKEKQLLQEQKERQLLQEQKERHLLQQQLQKRTTVSDHGSLPGKTPPGPSRLTMGGGIGPAFSLDFNTPSLPPLPPFGDAGAFPPPPHSRRSSSSSNEMHAFNLEAASLGMNQSHPLHPPSLPPPPHSHALPRDPFSEASGFSLHSSSSAANLSLPHLSLPAPPTSLPPPLPPPPPVSRPFDIGELRIDHVASRSAFSTGLPPASFPPLPFHPPPPPLPPSSSNPAFPDFYHQQHHHHQQQLHQQPQLPQHPQSHFDRSHLLGQSQFNPGIDATNPNLALKRERFFDSSMTSSHYPYDSI